MSHRTSSLFVATRLQQELRRLLLDAMELAPDPRLEPTEPPLDVLELADRLLVLVEVPGVDAEAIHLEVEGAQVRIQVEKHGRQPAAGETHFHCVECSRGVFERRLRVPPGFDAKRLRAHLEAGILKLVVPRLEESERAPRTVPIMVTEERTSRD